MDVVVSTLRHGRRELSRFPLYPKKFGPLPHGWGDLLPHGCGGFDVATGRRALNRSSFSIGRSSLSDCYIYAMAFLCSVFKDSVCHSFEATRITITRIALCYQHSIFGKILSAYFFDVTISRRQVII
jgi:hypothetical protein